MTVGLAIDAVVLVALDVAAVHDEQSEHVSVHWHGSGDDVDADGDDDCESDAYYFYQST